MYIYSFVNTVLSWFFIVLSFSSCVIFPLYQALIWHGFSIFLEFHRVWNSLISAVYLGNILFPNHFPDFLNDVCANPRDKYIGLFKSTLSSLSWRISVGSCSFLTKLDMSVNAANDARISSLFKRRLTNFLPRSDRNLFTGEEKQRDTKACRRSIKNNWVSR